MLAILCEVHTHLLLSPCLDRKQNVGRLHGKISERHGMFLVGPVLPRPQMQVGIH